MCTVTWAPVDGGYELFMNRDELHTRGPALPPARKTHDGVTYIAPTDSDAGGTWIAANEHGVVACLLNNFPSMLRMASGADRRVDTTRLPRGAESRGLIPPALMAARSLTELDSHLRHLDHTQFNPFYVFALGPGGVSSTASLHGDGQPPPVTARLYRWDGTGSLTAIPDPELPVSTSSFMAKEVLANRAAVFHKRMGVDPAAYADAVATNTRNYRNATSPADLVAYHRSHVPERGPYSVCVHRDDAGTKNFSRVSVLHDTVTFAYVDGPPCEDGPLATESIPLRP